MNYKIIHNEVALQEFIDWLPELKDNETFYLSLFARKKYAPELIQSNDKTQLKRFTSNKERMINKIKKLEVELGSYYLKDRVAPQESLVLYIHPTPRCQTRAAKLMAKKCLDLVFDDNKGYNIVAEALSCVQKAKAKSEWVHFDIDDMDINPDNISSILPSFRDPNRKVPANWSGDLIDTYLDNTPIYPYKWIQTRGGYHLMVNTGLVKVTFNFKGLDIPNWYKQITEMYPVEQSGDLMLPVIGCCQGKFVPKFIN